MKKKKNFIGLALCTAAYSHGEKGKDIPQTAATKIVEVAVPAARKNSPKTRQYVGVCMCSLKKKKKHMQIKLLVNIFEHMYMHVLHVESTKL